MFEDAKLSQLSSIMERKVTRKQFIALVGLGAVSLTSIANIAKLLNSKESATDNAAYGGNVYAGKQMVRKPLKRGV